MSLVWASFSGFKSSASSYVCPSISTDEKPVHCIASSHQVLVALPADVRRLFGFALSLTQCGDKHDAAKVLKGFGGAGVLEVVDDDVGGIYRAVHPMKIAQLYVKELRR